MGHKLYVNNNEVERSESLTECRTGFLFKCIIFSCLFGTGQHPFSNEGVNLVRTGSREARIEIKKTCLSKFPSIGEATLNTESANSRFNSTPAHSLDSLYGYVVF